MDHTSASRPLPASTRAQMAKDRLRHVRAAIEAWAPPHGEDAGWVGRNLYGIRRWKHGGALLVSASGDSAWGGSLELFSDPRREARPIKAILPLFNRGVIFETSEQSWHGFSEICLPAGKKALSRKSIALYFYTTERPPEQAAGRHSTVYVNRQLDDRFTEGYVLCHEDVLEMKHLFAVRDDHIREQYAEIAKLLQAQDRGVVGHFLYLAKRAYVRLRR